MALLFMDSFDHYTTADIAEKYSLVGAFGYAITAASGRRSTAGLVLTNENGWVTTRGLAPASSTVIVGIAGKTNGFTDTRQSIRVLSGVTPQLTVTFSGVGFPEVRRGDNTGPLLGTASLQVGTGVFFFLELMATIHSSAGSVNLRLNGVNVLTLAGINTAATGAAAWDLIRLNGGGALTTTFDDLYVCDGSGSAPWNTFLGDCRVDASFPTAAGATSAWTPSAGANWQCVDDSAPNDDTDYVGTATTGAVDTYVVADLPIASAVIYGVQHCMSMKKTDAGTALIAPVIRHSGADYAGSDIAPGTNYAFGVQIAATNPGTGSQWTVANFNAAEFGIKRTG